MKENGKFNLSPLGKRTSTHTPPRPPWGTHRVADKQRDGPRVTGPDKVSCDASSGKPPSQQKTGINANTVKTQVRLLRVSFQFSSAGFCAT